MHGKNFLLDIRRGWKTVASFGLLGLILVLVASFFQPFLYSSTVRVLIIASDAPDAVTASRSVERIATDLAGAAHFSSFFNKVMEAEYDIDANYFPSDDNARRVLWSNTVKADADTARGSGVMSIMAYHPDPAQAERIASAVAYILITEGWTYTSGGNMIVRLVDEPLTSGSPVKPDVVSNVLAGFFVGIVLGGVYVILKSNNNFFRHQV